MLNWLRQIFGSLIRDGESGQEMFKIHTVLRKVDGVVFQPGSIVNLGHKMLVVKNVYLSNDLSNIWLCVTDVNCVIPEEVVLRLDEVIPVEEGLMAGSAIVKLASGIADASLHELLKEMHLTPTHVKLMARKFTLAAKIRRHVCQFLNGLEMVDSTNLGLIDWDHDPKILEELKLAYRIEDCNTNSGLESLDEFLGPKWDMVDLSATMEGFRIVLTMDISLTTNADISVSTHAALCEERPEESSYRSQYLRCNENSSTTLPLSSPDNKTSLLWDSFSTRKDMLVSTPLMMEGTQDTIVAEEKLNCSEGSRAHSRFSGISQSTGASRPRLQGLFLKGPPSIRGTNQNPECPFPNEWKFGTVPEVIANDEEID